MPRFPSYVGVRIDAGPTATLATLDKPKAVSFSAPKPTTAPAPAPSSPPAGAGTTGKRYFEFVDGKSSKFWSVECNGCDVTTGWGRIGTAGQSKTKSFADTTAAAANAAKLVEEKTGEGYVEKPV